MSNIKALIIDDNDNNILVLEQLLRVESIQTTSLSSATLLESSITKLSDVDLIFLDLEMPDLNGYDALHIINSHSNMKNAKVIAYSVYVAEINYVMEQGFDAFLGKPLNAEEFPDQIKRILNGEHVRYIP